MLKIWKKSFLALYPKTIERSPNSSKNFNVAWARKPAVIPIVVGKEAAQTPSLLIVCSFSSTTARGVAQPKQAVSPGIMTWMWPEIASSETPDSNQIWSISLQA